MIARGCFYFLLYTFIVFFGTPTYIIIPQLVAIAICGAVLIKNWLSKPGLVFPASFWILLLSVALYIAFSMMRGLTNAPTTGPIAIRAGINLGMTLCIPFIAYAYYRQDVLAPKDILRHFLGAVATFAVVKSVIILLMGIFSIPL